MKKILLSFSVILILLILSSCASAYGRTIEVAFLPNAAEYNIVEDYKNSITCDEVDLSASHSNIYNEDKRYVVSNPFPSNETIAVVIDEYNYIFSSYAANNTRQGQIVLNDDFNMIPLSYNLFTTGYDCKGYQSSTFDQYIIELEELLINNLLLDIGFYMQNDGKETNVYIGINRLNEYVILTARSSSNIELKVIYTVK